MSSTKPLSRAAILAYIDADERLSKIRRFIDVQKFDQAHDVEHFLRVARWAKYIIDCEYPSDATVLAPLAVVAALLHDLKNLPKNHPLRGDVSATSALAARSLLLDAGFSESDTNIITDAIRVHSYSRNEPARSHVEKALQDADRLDALGSIGLLRCISTSSEIGSQYFHTTDPWAINRPYDDMAYALDHIFNRLLLLPGLMTTETGRRQAHARLEIMERFLLELRSEIDDHVDP